MDANILKQIIKIIVLTASKVQSTNSKTKNKTSICKKEVIKQQVIQNIIDVDDWEW